MLRKIDLGADFLKKHQKDFICPVCHTNFLVDLYGLVCQQNHRFDLSKKGTLYFLSHQIKTDYNQQMLTHRGTMIQKGLYAPLLNKIIQLIDCNGKTLDVGCGEGSFLFELSKLGLIGEKIGFDISKEGVYLASNHSIDAFWCVADLTNLPFANQSMDTVLNLFSPSHYNEFKRVLKPNGAVIKVVPEEKYLIELRQAFYPNDPQKQLYSNEKILKKFNEEMIVEKKERVTYTFDIPKTNQLDLLEMSPLEWQVTPETKAQIQKNPLEKITIDVCVLKGRTK